MDEFARYRWTGLHAAKQWADIYIEHAAKAGVTEGNVTYCAPARSEIQGSDAYVIVPTIYTYKQDG